MRCPLSAPDFGGQKRISAWPHKHTPSPLRASRTKRHLLSFHLNTEHTSLALCKDEGWNTKDMYRWCQQSLCLSLSSPPLPTLPPTLLKAARGSGAEAAGFFLLPTLSSSLSFSLFIHPSFLPPVLGKAGARRRAMLFLQRIDLTLTRLCFGWQKRPLRCTFSRNSTLAGRCTDL